MSDPRFDHFLLTRFNVKAQASSRPPPEPWLRTRLGILRELGIPSIRQQTVPPDHWLIFCDAGSPEWFLAELRALLGPKEHIVLVDGPSGAKVFADAILARGLSKPFLITSRMDNDDALALDFMEMVQRCFEEQEREFVNFTHGVQYRDGRFYAMIDPSNAFMSLIERCGGAGPMTVFIDWHNRLERHAPVRRVKSHPAWLQHVHGGNLTNAVRGIPIAPDSALPHFPAGIPVRKLSALALWLDRALVAPRLLVRVFSSVYRITWLAKSLSSGRIKSRS